MPGPIVFVASTCHDLVDLRAELKTDLEKDGFIVRLSDDWDSDFRVNTEVNSIESCLENLRSSDVGLFILDRRYGPELLGKYGGKSATHAEFDLAAKQVAEGGELKRLCFIRKRTWDELELWRAHTDTFDPKWVEKKRYKEFFQFIQEVRDLHNTEGRSNWVDQFETSVDLRLIARKRLYDLFPAQSGGRALTRERVVRLTLELSVEEGGPPQRGWRAIGFHVRNAGLNVAVDVEAYLGIGDQVPGFGKKYLPVMPVGERSRKLVLSDIPPHGRYLVCRYRNLWCDSYEVRAKINLRDMNDAFNPYELEVEEFRVIETGA